MVSIRAVGLDGLIADLTRAMVPDGSAMGDVASLVERATVGMANSRQMARSVRGNTYRAMSAGVEVTVGDGPDGRWAAGAQFGSIPRYRQFPGATEDGYTVIPAVKSNEERIGDLIADGITKPLL